MKTSNCLFLTAGLFCSTLIVGCTRFSAKAVDPAIDNKSAIQMNAIQKTYLPDEWIIISAKERQTLRAQMPESDVWNIWNSLSLEQKMALSETNKALEVIQSGSDVPPAAGIPYSVNQWLIKGPSERETLRATMDPNVLLALWNSLSLNQKNAMTIINKSYENSQVSSSGNLCAAFSDVRFVDMAWGNYFNIPTNNYGSFTNNTVFVFRIQIPAAPASYGAIGYTKLAEYQGPPTARQMTISENPCDFRSLDPTGAHGPLSMSEGFEVQIIWNVGADPLYLVPGKSYYFSVRNRDSVTGLPSCSENSCAAVINTYWPH